MERLKLYEAVKRLAPALAAKDLIPVFTCFCFSKKGVLAYDDLVAIWHPLESPIIGAVKGQILLDWLSSVKAKELKFSVADGDVTIKGGRAKIVMPILPKDDFLFEFPKDDAAGEIPLDKELSEALAKASVSMGYDPAHPTRLGVTLTADGKRIRLYSSDNRSATRVKLKSDLNAVSVLLPPRFCELLRELGKDDPPIKLLLTEQWIEAKFTSGLRLFSRAGAQVDASEYKQIFRGFDKIEDKDTVEVPKQLAKALDRAAVILPFADPKRQFSDLSVKSGMMKISTKSDAGNVNDRIEVEGHPDVDIHFSPDLLRRSIGYADRIRVTDKFTALKGNKFDHMVAVVEPEA